MPGTMILRGGLLITNPQQRDVDKLMQILQLTFSSQINIT